MPLEANKAVIRRFIEAFDQDDLDAAESCYSPDAVLHFPGSPSVMSRSEAMGLLQAFANGFPDGQHTIHQLIAEGDRVAGHWTFTGTHLGEFQGIPPTGKRVSVVAINIARIADGKITEFWASPDLLGMMQQLGVIPAPAETAA